MKSPRPILHLQKTPRGWLNKLLHRKEYHSSSLALTIQRYQQPLWSSTHELLSKAHALQASSVKDV
uniref:Uncharacterized protein n=1 Tax=Arundo donax TaxID=35708 RepID=A0A0A9GJ31_ARUDO